MYNYQEALDASTEYFGNDLSAKAFLDKYALKNSQGELLEKTPADMHLRIAKEISRIEKDKFETPLTEQEIFSLLDGFKRIIPQGSPMYGIGNKHQTISLSNCFVVDTHDSYAGICNTDQQIANISKRRGGIGFDITPLRPGNSRVQNAANTTTGATSFMHRFSHTLREVGQYGRRAAGLISISVHHPDVMNFITIKDDSTSVTGCNISVRLTDEFLKALKKKQSYELRWPENNPIVTRKQNAKEVWDKIIHNAWSKAEPGLLFWDNILRESPADCYGEEFATTSTNPCGEIPLCPYDSCRLLALNLFHYVKNPFEKDASFNYSKFKKDCQIAQRLMDDIVDLEIEAVDGIIKKVKNDPEPVEIKQSELSLWKKVRDKAIQGRRTGTGITALGDTLAALGVKYGSRQSIEIIEKIYKTLKLGCYKASVEMAKEIGPFPLYDHEAEKDCAFLLRIKEDDPVLYRDMVKYGRRNIAILTTAPTGTVSMMAQLAPGYHGTTSGIEPLFTLNKYIRRKKGNPGDDNFRSDFVDESGDHWMEFEVRHPGVEMWMEKNGSPNIEKCPYVGANDINWTNRVKMQAAANRHVDHSISSTINLPSGVAEDEVSKIYLEAWKAGLKGITVYRDGCRSGVLVNKKEAPPGSPFLNRPREVTCDVHHISVKGAPYFVLVGKIDDMPHEVFAGKNGVINKKVKSGTIIKYKRGGYKVILDNDEELCPITAFTTDEEDIVTRLISANLRNGVDIQLIVDQLRKAKGDLTSFSKSIAKALAKYIPNGTKMNQKCPDCGISLVNENGCTLCKSCGLSYC